MDLQSMRVPACVPVGVLATITMDVAMVAAGRLGESASTSDRYGPDVIGRWVTDSVRGRWRHGNITREPARRGELALGLLTHYLTGIVLTQVYLLPPRRGTGRRRFLGATAFGIATAVAPFFVLFPSIGYGLFGYRSGDAARVIPITLIGHTAFGVGIGLTEPCFTVHRPRP